VYDVDPSAAAAERQRALSDAAKQRYLVAFAHFSFPGIGNVRKESRGYT
jgi:hypothetical protein